MRASQHICVTVPGPRAARFALKSARQDRFFEDVRMTPAHFDELLAAVSPHLPMPAGNPRPNDPTYSLFSVLFWLADVGRQREVARALDVAEAIFSKHFVPDIHAIIAGLAKPKWPSAGESCQIGDDFVRMKGVNATGWSGPDVFGSSLGISDSVEYPPGGATLVGEKSFIFMLMLACFFCIVFRVLVCVRCHGWRCRAVDVCHAPVFTPRGGHEDSSNDRKASAPCCSSQLRTPVGSTFLWAGSLRPDMTLSTFRRCPGGVSKEPDAALGPLRDNEFVLGESGFALATYLLHSDIL